MEDFYRASYADDDALLNDWVDEGMRRIAWKMFERQGKWIYMSGELGEGRFPQIKDYKSVSSEFRRAFDDWIGWLESYMFDRYIAEVRSGNVDLGEDLEAELRFRWGDEEFEEWDAGARCQIFDEYAKMLGVERAVELFKKAWPDWER